MASSIPFVHLHAHNSLSNGSALFESISSVEDYIDKALEWSVPAVALSNHGMVVDWVANKQKIEKAGLKYIHAIEAYVTDYPDVDENGEAIDGAEKVRDNNHLLLLARNWEGVKEINKLSSTSFRRNDFHYYYNPRMYNHEVWNTSDNVIILTACLGSPLRKSPFQKEWKDFFIENKHRVWLEVQPHINDDQIKYNKFILDMAKEHDMNIVATNDVHHVSEEHANISRDIKHKYKGIKFDNDDEFDVWYKSREEMVDTFKKQGVLSDEEIELSLNNSMDIVNEVEDFELDLSHKYPKMFDPATQEVGMINVSYLSKEPLKDSEEVFKRLTLEGYKDRGIHKLPKSEQNRYKERIRREMEVYVKTGTVDYMLLEWSVKKDAREKRVNPDKAIYPGYGRGSVSGSVIAYLLRVTEMDAVKENLDFDRFMNSERISLADIDSDFTGEDQQAVQKYLLEHPKLHCASIVTKNTLGLKGSVKAFGKTIGYGDSELNDITKQFESEEDIPSSLYEANKELFDYAINYVKGSVESFGRHAAGILVSSEPIDEVVGTMSLPNWDYPVTQLDMKSIDSTNFVKLDILSLDNLALIQIAGEMAGLGYLTPDSDDIIDFQDEKVWRSMAEENVGIFQFESDRAGGILADMFSDETLSKIKSKNPDVRYIDLLSLANASQRPSGSSYIEEVTAGNTKDNGHEALNEFLAPTLGELVYQEQQTRFLVEFCGWSGSEADLIRRGIGKKDHKIMEEEVPKIKPSFIKTMMEKYGDSREHAEAIADDFIQVFMDSVDYGFSVNHSQAYSYIGYISAWLRYYYPLEFVAAGLQTWGKGDKNVDFLNYAEKHGISINPPKFRKSRGGYYVDKANNAIYEGTGHIKGGNSSVGEILYQLRDRDYASFTDLVVDVIENGSISLDVDGKQFDGSIQDMYKKYSEKEIKSIDKANKDGDVSYSKSPLGINKTKMLGLIRLRFFEEFGGNKKLENVYNYVTANYKPGNKTFANKAKKYKECLDYEDQLNHEYSLDDENFSIIEQCEFELHYTGRVVSSNSKVPQNYFFVTELINVGKTRTTAEIYSINIGKTLVVKVGSSIYRNASFEEGDLLDIPREAFAPKAKRVKKDGEWIKHPTDVDIWVKKLTFIRKSKLNKKSGKKK